MGAQLSNSNLRSQFVRPCNLHVTTGKPRERQTTGAVLGHRATHFHARGEGKSLCRGPAPARLTVPGSTRQVYGPQLQKKKCCSNTVPAVVSRVPGGKHYSFPACYSISTASWIHPGHVHIVTLAVHIIGESVHGNLVARNRRRRRSTGDKQCF